MKPFRIALPLVATAAGLLFAATGRAQNEINTFPAWNGNSSIGSWGVPNTATYGEIFTPTAGETTPRSITFAIDNDSGTAIPFQAFVYKFSADAITGPALFQSSVSSVPTVNAFKNIKVSLNSTGHGGLAPGQQYVVFYSVSGLGGPSAESAWGLIPTSSPSGGFAYNNNGNSFATLFNAGSWEGPFDEAAFLLNFGISFSQFALTPNQHAVAHALDFAIGTNNPGIQNLVDYLADEPINYLPATFDMISGEEYTSIYDTAYSIAHLQNNAIFNHLAEIHAGAPGFSMGLVSLDMAAGGKTSSDGKEGKTVIQPTQDDRWGFFATANGDLTDIGGDGNASGFEYATEGLTMGADYRLLPGLVAGTYLGYEHSFTSLTNGGSLDQNGITGGLYSSFFSHGFYLNGIVGGGYSGFTARRLSAGGFTRGDGNNTILNAATSGGYDMHSGPWTFGPQAGLEYDDVGLQSFTENGSLAPLSVGSQSEDSLRSTAGAHVSYTTQVGGVTIRPDVHAAWQHEYDNTADSLGAQIAGTNAVFVVQGPNLGRDSVLAGAGVTVEVSDKTSISLDYEGQFGRTNESQSDLSLGFQTKF